MGAIEKTEHPPRREEMPVIALSPRGMLRFAMWSALILILMNGAVLASRVLTGHGRLLGFGPMFYVGQEANVPTWLSSTLLLACSTLLWIIWWSSKLNREVRSVFWKALAIIFLIMSIDECATIHETIGTIFEDTLRSDLFRIYGFMLPGVVIVCVISLLFLRFVLSLPRDTRMLFLLAGALYGAGASAMEAVSLGWAARHSASLPFYALLVTVEETLELSGVLVFLYALTSYLARHMPEVCVVVRGRDMRPRMVGAERDALN
jgi:hypothetical protein